MNRGAHRAIGSRVVARTMIVRRLARASAALLALLVVVACRDAARPPPGPPSPPAQRAFYYWRTTLALSPAETQALAALAVERLYLRMFDVGWQDSAATVIAPVVIAAAPPAGLEIVPVVYLKNEVFTHLDDAGAAALAATTWREVATRTAALGAAPRELQLDCDWSDSTRDRFFGFVRAIRGQLPPGVALSATIRLHQIKYRERTGVPPVDRGMLMFYNMGRFSADPEARAIFDADAAGRYLARLREYPLPLDGALPIWSWVIHLRDDLVEGLMQSTDPGELAGLDFVTASGPDRYTVTRTTFLHGTLVRAGDVLKVEVTGPTETAEAARLLTANLARVASPRTIALFDLSERNLARHDVTALTHVFQTAR